MMVSIVMGDPQARWLVFVREIPLKWMIWETPASGNPHVSHFEYTLATWSLDRLSSTDSWPSAHSSERAWHWLGPELIERGWDCWGQSVEKTLRKCWMVWMEPHQDEQGTRYPGDSRG